MPDWITEEAMNNLKSVKYFLFELLYGTQEKSKFAGGRLLSMLFIIYDIFLI